ncbi:hypothetical protein LEP1GSC132_2909 [Leptospira kirschneri str. 200803703]|nr:hypothetical protein LEP1GSC044_3966 [Leptospira kirschneri serovar Grippotyphosa str. RM52]EKQ85273.1 hypothetical protein LEP1GSC064_3368 [Leptospira kirschneri serovar Grippotyphosa str. Moskva]EKR06673.1 hypothetical protein LEP1GSC122_1195 [Leptospira kirschneri serovar Valbuzzi str. 200702274]EMK07682.1 hypothetical protein LEP1GSC176_0622 [Leptospira kirschneri str. MMD1493]EMO65717.1 hypothetical protein LEP1GSC132_2909 [Leptospira kirschneri str. 200803703]EMO77416.1 hypothetical p
MLISTTEFFNNSIYFLRFELEFPRLFFMEKSGFYKMNLYAERTLIIKEYKILRLMQKLNVTITFLSTEKLNLLKQSLFR